MNQEGLSKVKVVESDRPACVCHSRSELGFSDQEQSRYGIEGSRTVAVYIRFLLRSGLGHVYSHALAI
jgi:hypothetical protein